MKYAIEVASSDDPTDAELERILQRVYVDSGYADARFAETQFAAETVRSRGEILVAASQEKALMGMVIVVPPSSRYSKLAKSDEVELHLLAVLPEFRRHGIARRLVSVAVQRAKKAGFVRMLLWTQPSMSNAHRLYESVGFARRAELDFSRDGRDFWVYDVRI